MMLTLRDIASVPGEGEVVTVTGHVPWTWTWTWRWWLLGGMTAMVVLCLLIVAVRRRKRTGA